MSNCCCCCWVGRVSKAVFGCYFDDHFNDDDDVMMIGEDDDDDDAEEEEEEEEEGDDKSKDGLGRFGLAKFSEHHLETMGILSGVFL